MLQMESLLELVQMEQNIYNTVFHEVIRQATVSCAERGQLLAKLRLAVDAKSTVMTLRFNDLLSQLCIMCPDSATSGSWSESPAV